MQSRNGDRVEPTDRGRPGKTLADLPRLAVSRVADVCADDDDSARLKAMGICVGREIQLVQQGDPLIARVVGMRIGLSRRLAEHVLMQPLEPTSPSSEINGAP